MPHRQLVGTRSGRLSREDGRPTVTNQLRSKPDGKKPIACPLFAYGERSGGVRQRFLLMHRMNTEELPRRNVLSSGSCRTTGRRSERKRWRSPLGDGSGLAGSIRAVAAAQGDTGPRSRARNGGAGVGGSGRLEGNGIFDGYRRESAAESGATVSDVVASDGTEVRMRQSVSRRCWQATCGDFARPATIESASGNELPSRAAGSAG